jgi:hypothetical protein
MPMDGSGHDHGKGPLTVSLRFPIMDTLRRNWPVSLDKLSVSLVRVGRPKRRGTAIKVGQMRLEAGTR